MASRSAAVMPVLVGVAAATMLLAVDALAQVDLRSTFPGRRVGGATRGECSARLLAHLVPESSVYAPGTPVTLAVLEGPTAMPYPLLVSLRPQAGGAAFSRTLPASAAGVTLLQLKPLQAATVWESSYRCDEGQPVSADLLSFVSASSPPALSLLVADRTPADRTVEASLQSLRRHCGKSVPKQQLARDFGLDELKTADWPDQLPVRCPS